MGRGCISNMKHYGKSFNLTEAAKKLGGVTRPALLKKGG
jgi:hypothetical protein